MSLGGAFANSGGFVSIACCLVSAALAKLSSDQVVSLRSTFPKECISYETIGEKCYGFVGKALVLMNKSLFAFGCLVAYVIVIKDNFGQGLEGILYHNNNTCNSTFRTLLRNDTMVATIICTVVILPICLIMRRRQSISSYLSILSLISILSTLFLVAIVIYLYFVNNNVPTNNEKNDDTLFVKRWLQIRIGLFPSLGTFVFAFIPHHTIDVTYDSLRNPSLQRWKVVSFWSLFSSLVISLMLGIFVYMTFWEETKSDFLNSYPPSLQIEAAKLFLCANMILTFVLPFIACREMISTLLLPNTNYDDDESSYCESLMNTSSDVFQATKDINSELHESLLNTSCNYQIMQPDDNDDRIQKKQQKHIPTHVDDDLPQQQESELLLSMISEDFLDNFSTNKLIEDEHLHLFIWMTILLWGTIVAIALTAPNLGIVLDIVGSISGSMIGFILPGLFSIKLQGFSFMGLLMVIVGAIVGSVGAYFSIMKLVFL